MTGREAKNDDARFWHLASFAALQHFGSYWGKADMPNEFLANLMR
jgi:hypothetical protein